jgi:DNA repair protein RadC
MSGFTLQHFSDTVHSQGDDELIAKLVSSRTKPTHVSRKHDLADLSRATPPEIAKMLGVTAASALRVATAFELGRRAMTKRDDTRMRLKSGEDIYRAALPRVAGWSQEVFLVIGIDIRNHVLDILEIGRGSLFGVEVHPREIFRPLIRMAAAAGILVHNHPSGDPTPSEDDVILTRRMRDVGVLMGVPIVDHVVIAQTGWRSVAEYLGVDIDLSPESP